MNPLSITEAAAEDIMDTVLTSLADETKAIPITLSRDWAYQKVPDGPGVYVVFEGKAIVYVGESGSLQKRMIDLLDSRHHQLRRNIGRAIYSRHKAFVDASSKAKFPPAIELLLNSYIQRNLRVAHYPVFLGRREIEEKLFEKEHPIYNIKGRRS